MPLTLIGFIGTAAGFVSTITFLPQGNKNMANKVSERPVFSYIILFIFKRFTLAVVWHFN